MSGVPLSTATVPAGVLYATSGRVTLPGSGAVYSWLATLGGAATPQGDLLALNGDMAGEVKAAGGNAALTNPSLSALNIPDGAAGLALGGLPNGSASTGAVSDLLAFRFFNETLPANVTFVLWDSGSGEAGQTASFTVSGAGAGDVPVSGPDWSFTALQPYSTPSGATVKAVNGVVDVAQGAGGASSPDAVVLFTSAVPLTSMTVQASAALADTWGVALADAVAQNNPPCFVAGTAIMTPAGPVPVEHLAPGDAVVTRFAGVARIRWTGRRRLAPGRHRDPEAAFPVRILRDAVADGVPVRDLLLSPDHAVFLGGVLIPVKYLLNGVTIFQDRGFASVEYWHVELARHDVLLAEALPAETYLDTGNRAAFEQAGTALSLHPRFAPNTWEADACARLCGAGAPVAQVRAALAQPVHALPWVRSAGL